MALELHNAGELGVSPCGGVGFGRDEANAVCGVRSTSPFHWPLSMIYFFEEIVARAVRETSSSSLCSNYNDTIFRCPVLFRVQVSIPQNIQYLLDSTPFRTANSLMRLQPQQMDRFHSRWLDHSIVQLRSPKGMAQPLYFRSS